MGSNYIRQWRNKRGMTMFDLAHRAEVSKSVLSRLERGQQRYNEDLISRLAVVLGVSNSDLIARDPDNQDPIVEALSGLTPAQTAQVLAIIKAIKDTPNG